MLTNKHWNILVVDDEPDVLAVSKLALKQLRLYGLPLMQHEAKSKKDAIRFLTEDPNAGFCGVAIIDVVMETDHAGLELCQFIREEMKNPVMSLVIRTGQPGKAPEREVIDRYDISGYIQKVEATDDRLYSLLKGAIRQSYTATNCYLVGAFLNNLCKGLGSRDAFLSRLRQNSESLARDRMGRRIEDMEGNIGVFLGDAYVGIGAFEDRARATEIRQRLKKGEKVSLSSDDPDGDRMYYADKQVLVELVPTASVPSCEFVFTVAAWPSPNFVNVLWYEYFKSLQALWATLNN